MTALNKSCNVMCGPSLTHTFQQKTGRLTIGSNPAGPFYENPNYGPQPFVLTPFDTIELKIPMFSLLVGFTGNPAGAYSTDAISNIFQPINGGALFTTDLTNSNSNMLERLLCFSGDQAISLEKATDYLNKQFLTCEGFKTINGTNPDINQIDYFLNTLSGYRSYRITSIVADSYNVWPIYLDFSWLYSDQIDSRA